MSSPHRIYLDTSLYLGFILDNVAHKQIEKHLSQNHVCSSTFLFLESERNLVRLSRDKVLNPQQYSEALERLHADRETFILRDLTINICVTGYFPAVSTPRSSDLIHLRTALWFQKNGGLSTFLTLDTRQRQAAKELGLPADEVTI